MRSFLRIGLLLVLFVTISKLLYAQETGSGTVTFSTTNANERIPIKATAQLIDIPSLSFEIIGNTNETIPFSDWTISVLPTAIDELDGKHEYILQNPAPSLHIVLKGSPEQPKALVYNLQGQVVAEPRVTTDVREGFSIVDPLHNVPDGQIIILIATKSKQFTIKFVKDSNAPMAAPIEINESTDENSSPVGGRTTGMDNFTLSWDGGFGVVAGSQDVEIVEGNNNDITVNVDVLDQAYFTINGSLANATNGRAVWSVNGVGVDSVDFNNGSFSITNLNSDYDINNNVDDISGNVTIKSPINEFETEIIPLNLTDDLPGENIYNTGAITVTPITKYGNATFKLVDDSDGRTIENIIATYDNNSTPVDSVFSLNNVPVGNYNVNFATSDSTWIMFNNFSQNFNLVEGENNFVISVDGNDKTFTGTLDFDVNDTEVQTLENMTATIDGVQFVLGANGTVAQQTYDIPANSQKPWLAGTRDVDVGVIASDSSFQITNPVSITYTLQEGANSEVVNVTTVPFNWSAEIPYVITDNVTSNPINSATISAEGLNVNTDVNGQATLSIPLVAGPNFWQPETDKIINFDIVKTGYEDFVAEDLTVNEGVNPTVNRTLTEIVQENLTGDVRILPYLGGTGINETIITMTNKDIPDSTYTVDTGLDFYGTFTNIYVQNAGPVQYELKIEPKNENFLPTNILMDMYQDVNFEINGNQSFDVDPIPNVQDITAFVYDYTDLNKEAGVNVELVRSSDDVVLDTQVSDANGKVFFNDVPGETQVYLRNSKTGFYTKTNGTYTTPLVDLLSEMDTTLNVVALPIQQYEDATTITADTLKMYKPDEYNTEFLLGHLRTYFPPAAQRQTVIDHFDDVATTLGFDGAIIDYNTPFAQPTTPEIDAYWPYQENREVHEGTLGTNITNYSGTETGTGKKLLPNGSIITFYTTTFDLGGLDWSDTDHEIGNMLGFPLLNGNHTTFKTSRELGSPNNYAIVDSKHDKAIMPIWLNLGKLHYDTTDAQGRLLEYNVTTKFE